MGSWDEKPLASRSAVCPGPTRVSPGSALGLAVGAILALDPELRGCRFKAASTVGRTGGWHCRRVLALSREHPDGGNFEQKEKNEAQQRPRRDLNPQSSDPESDALSIRPRGLAISSHVAFLIKLIQAPAWCVLMRMLRAQKRSMWVGLRAGLLR